MARITRRFRYLWLFPLAASVALLFPTAFVTVVLRDSDALAVIPQVQEYRQSSTFTGKPISNAHVTYPPTVLVDPGLPHYRTLLNRFLLGPYINNRIPEHTMDAVVMASGPDATLAVSIHNLHHLCGFRRFIVVVNNSTRDCPIIMDMMPQHNPTKPHLCLDHHAFYTEKERQRIASEYPALHRGAPGKLRRGNVKVQIPRIGWYLQQFSKFLVPRLIPDLSPQYLAIDGDLVFTRPFSFVASNGTYVMPTTTKSPKNWWYFVDWIFGNDAQWQNDTDTTDNFVVGWMVLDQVIVNDLIRDMDRRIDDKDTFPFNILNQGEKIINQTFFSEFYIYARYANHHIQNPMYRRQSIPEPIRNLGGFRYTCVLTKKVYEEAQNTVARAPFLIWEAHKHYAFDSCPDRETTQQMTQLSTIGIWHDFHPPPWGGGNQFLLALREGLQRWNNMTVLVKSDVVERKESKSSATQAKHTASNAQVLLANSVTFKGNMDLLEKLKANNNLALVHRVDGPYYSTRYGRSLHNLTIDSGMNAASVQVPQEDKKTKQLNRQLACATVFQSHWSLEANLKVGLKLRNPVLIPNTVDPAIFYPPPDKKELSSSRKIRILATSHSSNARKGFDTLLWIDGNLDWTRFEVVYMGGTPKSGFEPVHITILSQVDSQGVADFLRTGDIYLAPSRDEPASNAVMEALACGLPVLYQEGSSHGDLVGGAGRGFSRAGPELIKALDEMVQNYDQLLHAISVPTMMDVSRKYLAIMRWCFYMKHLLFDLQK